MSQARIINADVLVGLAQLEAGSVQCVVTSPPYWGLRDYGTASWNGGAAGCDHKGEPMRTKAYINANTGTGQDVKNAESRQFYRETCGKCGAIRQDSQIGLEATPEAYVTKMVEVFREVRRVMADDATLWLNLGDSYATGGGAVGRCPGGGEQGKRFLRQGHINTQPNRMPIPGLKPKDLVGIPWRVAFALQADGWWLRSDIIWSKPNPMPESVTDRPTKAHEYLFLMAKRERYYYNQEAISEPAAYAGDQLGLCRGTKRRATSQGRVPSGNEVIGADAFQAESRNRRTVWTVVSEPFPDAHFATFPQALVEPCILAGSKPGDLVLDPFAGSGTVGIVALRYGRRFVGVELNPTYATMARRRIVGPLFADAEEQYETLRGLTP